MCHKHFKVSLFIILAGVWVSLLSVAQEETSPEDKEVDVLETDKKAEFKKLPDFAKSKRSIKSSFLPIFPNINADKTRNEKKIRSKLIEYEKAGDEEKLFPLLKNYVKNFSISDFKHHSWWIWRLAQMYEKQGRLEVAKEWYKVAIKHKPKNFDVDRLLKHYDSLTVNDRDYFVSLAYFYELVDARKAIDTLQAPRSVLINMGSKINSDVADYAPMLSPDDKFLVFTSKRHKKNGRKGKVVNEDLFIAQRFGPNDYGKAVSFEDVNTDANEGSACFSSDGKLLIFSRCHSLDGLGHCDLYQSTKGEDDKWSKPVNLGPNVNSVFWDSHPSLSYSADTLFFSSSRDERSFGQEDIFYSVRDKNQEWGKAMNIGPIINTSGREIAPFMHHNHDILYFSSNQQLLNFGGMDIYKSYKLSENRREGTIVWTEPLNIGPLVNGKENEYYFSIDASSSDLFYAKSVGDDPNQLDLFSFPLPMEAQPDAVVQVTGSFKDEDEQPFQGIVSIVDLDHGVEVTPKFLRPNGTFAFNLIDGRRYLIIIQGDEFFRFEDLFALEGTKQLDYTAERISKTIEFKGLEFETESAELTEDMYTDLFKIVDFMVDNPNFKLKVSGHTDSTGTEAENITLSQERAEAIVNWISVQGNIDDDRFTAVGYGSSKPIKKGDTEENRAINRRVEFELTKTVE